MKKCNNEKKIVHQRDLKRLEEKLKRQDRKEDDKRYQKKSTKR